MERVVLAKVCRRFEQTACIDALIDTIPRILKKGENASLLYFGTFEVRKRAARTSRSQVAGVELMTKISKQSAFNAGATLKDTVNDAKK